MYMYMYILICIVISLYCLIVHTVHVHVGNFTLGLRLFHCKFHKVCQHLKTQKVKKQTMSLHQEERADEQVTRSHDGCYDLETSLEGQKKINKYKTRLQFQSRHLHCTNQFSYLFARQTLRVFHDVLIFCPLSLF